jgi:hypothetical protein
MKPFTHLKLKSELNVKGHSVPFNTLTVICPECVAKAMPNGEIYDKFVERYYKTKNKIYTARLRNATAGASATDASCDCSVPDGQSVGTVASGKDAATPAIEGSKTIQ